jgi:hypothetical protein
MASLVSPTFSNVRSLTPMCVLSFSRRILGAFVAGIIVPREGGLTIAMTEKLEDMVSIIFLPLVSDLLFALSSHFLIPSDVGSISLYLASPPIWAYLTTVRYLAAMYWFVYFSHGMACISGITWAYTIAICTLAFVGKFGGCTIAARYFAGFNWREASAIGSLMSCKGYVLLMIRFGRETV